MANPDTKNAYYRNSDYERRRTLEYRDPQRPSILDELTSRPSGRAAPLGGASVGDAPYEGVRYSGSAPERTAQRWALEKVVQDYISAGASRDIARQTAAGQKLMTDYNYSEASLAGLTKKTDAAKSLREALDVGRSWVAQNDFNNARRNQAEATAQPTAPMGRGNAPEGAIIVGNNWFQNIDGNVKSGRVGTAAPAQVAAPQTAAAEAPQDENAGSGDGPWAGGTPAAPKAYEFGFTQGDLSKSAWAKGSAASPNPVTYRGGTAPQRLLSGDALAAFKAEHPEAAKSWGDDTTHVQIDYRPVVGRDKVVRSWKASATPFDMTQQVQNTFSKAKTQADADSLGKLFSAVSPAAPVVVATQKPNPRIRRITRS